VLSLYPRVRGVWAVLVAALGGMLVSGTMEAVQNYLPSRVPSNLDLFTNSAGCLAGACIGPCSPRAARPEPPVPLRRRWFAPHASQGLVLVALWPLAQVYPQGYLFGNGQILPLLSEWLSDWLDTDIDLVAMMRGERRHDGRAVLAVRNHHHRLRHDRRRPHPAVPARRGAPQGWLMLALLAPACWSRPWPARCSSRPITPSPGSRRAPRAAS
jgi:hypothetical protein